MIYKVWIQVEEIDEEADHYQNVSEPVELGVFRTKAAAEDLVRLAEQLLGFQARRD